MFVHLSSEMCVYLGDNCAFIGVEKIPPRRRDSSVLNILLEKSHVLYVFLIVFRRKAVIELFEILFFIK